MKQSRVYFRLHCRRALGERIPWGWGIMRLCRSYCRVFVGGPWERIPGGWGLWNYLDSTLDYFVGGPWERESLGWGIMRLSTSCCRLHYRRALGERILGGWGLWNCTSFCRLLCRRTHWERMGERIPGGWGLWDYVDLTVDYIVGGPWEREARPSPWGGRPSSCLSSWLSSSPSTLNRWNPQPDWTSCGKSRWIN